MWETFLHEASLGGFYDKVEVLNKPPAPSACYYLKVQCEGFGGIWRSVCILEPTRVAHPGQWPLKTLMACLEPEIAQQCHSEDPYLNCLCIMTGCDLMTCRC